MAGGANYQVGNIEGGVSLEVIKVDPVLDL